LTTAKQTRRRSAKTSADPLIDIAVSRSTPVAEQSDSDTALPAFAPLSLPSAESVSAEIAKPQGCDLVDKKLALEVKAEIEKAMSLTDNSEIETVANAVVDRLFDGDLAVVKRYGSQHQTYKHLLASLKGSQLSPGHITRCVHARLLASQLPAEIGSKLSLSHCRVLLGVTDPSERELIAERAAKECWSKKLLENEIRAMRTNRRDKSPVSGRPPDTPLEILAKAASRIEIPGRAQIVDSIRKMGCIKARELLELLHTFTDRMNDSLNDGDEEMQLIDNAAQTATAARRSVRVSQSPLDIPEACPNPHGNDRRGQSWASGEPN